MADPSGINLDKYGEGWLFEMCPADDNTAADLMSGAPGTAEPKQLRDLHINLRVSKPE